MVSFFSCGFSDQAKSGMNIPRHARARPGHPRLSWLVPWDDTASKAWMAGTSPAMTAGNAFPALGTRSGIAYAPLAFRGFWPQIGTGILAGGEPLANRVRSGRKQP